MKFFIKISKGWPIAILFFVAIFMFHSCQIKNNDFKKLHWLAGTWDVNEGQYFESWEIKNTQLFVGKSFKINPPSDTIILETIELTQIEGDIFYIPTVSSQNNSQPIPFKLSSISENEVVFENPNHDFPKKISYSKIDETKAKAQISDDKKTITFNLSRVK